MTVRSEMNALYDSAGTDVVSTAYYLTWAKANPDSQLYKRLKCDDDAAAADLWRHSEIRVLVAVHIRDDSGTRRTISLMADRAKTGGGYRDIDDVVKNPELYKMALKEAFLALVRVKQTYEHLQELKPIWDTVEETRVRSTGRDDSDDASHVAA